MINPRFVDYFRENFFSEKPEELQEFLASIELSIPRTIRIKPDMIEEVKIRLEKDGWILHPTNVFNVFSLDRREDFDPLERRIGFSLDHLVGNFYIQELAAAQPVDILADHTIQEKNFLILDLASSPGGKTTQLAEYFPNSFIIANEPTRERIPQLLQNLERMHTPNVAITLYPGQYWKNFPETFDRILLDAPCSGEGTLYKCTDAVKHWHLKNIKQIARLQERLLDAALHALKVGGEMIYSTCALNLLENEGVVNAMMEKYPGAFEILFQKKYWPHIDKTGGFFVTKIQKIASLERKESEVDNSWKTEKKSSFKTSNTALGRFHGRLGEWKEIEGITLYEHEGKVLAVANAKVGEPLREKIFPMRYGEYIGNIVNGKYEPNIWAFPFLDTSNTEKYTLQDEVELDMYLRGNPLESDGEDDYVLIEYEGVPIGLEKRKEDMISNRFPKDWQRK
ncbi:MAG: hypothetical protein PHY14_05105 [Candidatus Gracilibacteria bacterium]|nr:hypothetical protein [Candidatus Gracilibacteria bacterium]